MFLFLNNPEFPTERKTFENEESTGWTNVLQLRTYIHHSRLENVKPASLENENFIPVQISQLE